MRGKKDATTFPIYFYFSHLYIYIYIYIYMCMYKKLGQMYLK